LPLSILRAEASVNLKFLILAANAFACPFRITVQTAATSVSSSASTIESARSSSAIARPTLAPPANGSMKYFGRKPILVTHLITFDRRALFPPGYRNGLNVDGFVLLLVISERVPN